MDTREKLDRFRSYWRNEGLVPAILTALEFYSPPELRYRFRFLKEEYASYDEVDLPPWRRLTLWRRGFYSRSVSAYDFDEFDVDDYLSDYHQLATTRTIDEPFGTILNNKYVFHQVVGRHTDRLPELYSVVLDGEIHPATGATYSGGTDPGELLDRHGDFVVKPISGGGGEEVALCRSASGGCRIDGEVHSRTEFGEWVDDLDEVIVTEYVHQDGYANTLYPDTPNTIRIVTMVDPDTREPFIAEAVQRIGTSRSGAVDNFGRGGLSAVIGEDGELGSAVQYTRGSGETWHETHPDTGARIAGTRIPRWRTITDGIVGLADRFEIIPYVGWDVLPTANGYYVLEGNSFPDLSQRVEPILADDRVRRFYRYHGVI